MNIIQVLNHFIFLEKVYRFEFVGDDPKNQWMKIYFQSVDEPLCLSQKETEAFKVALNQFFQQLNNQVNRRVVLPGMVPNPIHP